MLQPALSSQGLVLGPEGFFLFYAPVNNVTRHVGPKTTLFLFYVFFGFFCLLFVLTLCLYLADLGDV